MNTFKKAWAKMDRTTRMFVVFEGIFAFFLLFEMFTVGVGFTFFVDYLLFAIMLMPMLYSDKAFEVWKEPFIKVKLAFSTSESLKDGKTEDN